jgi:RNA polymerase sigma-70 factor (ECF subfamily)
VIYKSIDVLKKRKLQTIELDSWENIPVEATLDEEEHQFKVSKILNAIEELPDGYRTVMCLYLFENYSHIEIAQILNITPATVRTLYWKARQKIKQKFKKLI